MPPPIAALFSLPLLPVLLLSWGVDAAAAAAIAAAAAAAAAAVVAVSELVGEAGAGSTAGAPSDIGKDRWRDVAALPLKRDAAQGKKRK